MDSAEWLSNRYVLHRELHEKNKLLLDWQPVMPWPPVYDTKVIGEAMRFIVFEEQERRKKRAFLLNDKVDGLEVTEEIEGDSGAEEFIVIKGEDDLEEL